jgi:hypothetical protein
VTVFDKLIILLKLMFESTYWRAQKLFWHLGIIIIFFRMPMSVVKQEIVIPTPQVA